MTDIPYSSSLPQLLPGQTAHVAVHVQNYFFKPSCPRPSEAARQPFVDQVVKNIAGISGKLHREGVPTCWAVMENDDIGEDQGKLCKGIRPREGDIIVADNERSAIKTADLLEKLKESGIDTLIVSGGYASECVTDTVIDALEVGFNVVVIADCLADNRDDIYVRDMADHLRTGRLFFTDRQRLDTALKVARALTSAHNAAVEAQNPQTPSATYDAPAPL